MRFRTSPQHMKPFIIIVDYKYYLDCEQEINEWCNNCVPGWKQAGMVLEFKSEQDRLAFVLRWN